MPIVERRRKRFCANELCEEADMVRERLWVCYPDSGPRDINAGLFIAMADR